MMHRLHIAPVVATVIAFAVTFASLEACGERLPPEPPHVVVYPDASYGTCCDSACRVLYDLGCPEAEPSGSNESCESICTRAANLGVDIGSCCIASATSRREAMQCRNATGGYAVRCTQ